MSNIFEGLLRRDTSGALKPALATSWERIDKNTWRFKLRQDVKFHNGNPFTWEDVKFTFDRLKNPEVSEFISFGSLIDLIQPVNGDDSTIDVKTKEPVPYFDQNLHQIFIMDKEFDREPRRRRCRPEADRHRPLQVRRVGQGLLPQAQPE